MLSIHCKADVLVELFCQCSVVMVHRFGNLNLEENGLCKVVLKVARMGKQPSPTFFVFPGQISSYLSKVLDFSYLPIVKLA
jgi:hypothetical protein